MDKEIIKEQGVGGNTKYGNLFLVLLVISFFVALAAPALGVPVGFVFLATYLIYKYKIKIPHDTVVEVDTWVKKLEIWLDEKEEGLLDEGKGGGQIVSTILDSISEHSHDSWLGDMVPENNAGKFRFYKDIFVKAEEHVVIRIEDLKKLNKQEFLLDRVRPKLQLFSEVLEDLKQARDTFELQENLITKNVQRLKNQYGQEKDTLKTAIKSNIISEEEYRWKLDTLRDLHKFRIEELDTQPLETCLRLDPISDELIKCTVCDKIIKYNAEKCIFCGGESRQ